MTPAALNKQESSFHNYLTEHEIRMTIYGPRCPSVCVDPCAAHVTHAPCGAVPGAVRGDAHHHHTPQVQLIATMRCAGCGTAARPRHARASPEKRSGRVHASPGRPYNFNECLVDVVAGTPAHHPGRAWRLAEPVPLGQATRVRPPGRQCKPSQPAAPRRPRTPGQEPKAVRQPPGI